MEYWEQRWQNADTGWDLRAASPPLAAYLRQIALEDRDMTVLVPGCGSGYEALLMLELGFKNVTMLDIAPSAVERLRQRLDAEGPADWQKRLSLVCEDFFAHKAPYDLILEQTFFCALNPALRRDYAVKMSELLRPQGRLVGLLFDAAFESGPPFGGSKAEYVTLFAPHFSILKMEACYNSVPPRAGRELFFMLSSPTSTSR
jgi:methyl halide transferase